MAKCNHPGSLASATSWYCPECGAEWGAVDALKNEVARLDKENEQLRATLNQRGHVAEFREDGYALEHPIECRTAGLIDCPVNRACEREQVAPALGRFYVSVDEDGNLLLGDAP